MISGALGGIPGYHALSLTALAERMNVDARVAGLIAAAVPLAAVVFGASVIELIPRMIVGGVLVFLGLAFLVEWVWDKRKVLPPVEYGVVLVILAAIIGKGFLPGVVVGLVLAVVLFAVNYGRIELVREVAFGETYHSNVDRPRAERAALRSARRCRPDPARERVRVLRLGQRPARADPKARGGRAAAVPGDRPPTGDRGGLLGGGGLRQGDQPRRGPGFELVFTGVSEPVRKQLARGGVVAGDGSCGSSPTWTAACSGARRRCSETRRSEPAELDGDALAGMPAGPAHPTSSVSSCPRAPSCSVRTSRPATCTCVEFGPAERGDGDGRRDPDAAADACSAGVVVGEVAMYTGVPRTADVVAETPSVVLELSDVGDRTDRGRGSRARRARCTGGSPAILSERLRDTLREFDALLD